MEGQAEQSCSNCIWFHADETTDGMCYNDNQVWDYVASDEYCLFHELIPKTKTDEKETN